MNCFNLPKENNDWIVPEDQYDEKFKNWRGPIHNGQFRSQNLNEKRNTEETCSKYVGSDDFNGILREGKPEITIKSYKDQFCEHMIRNGGATWSKVKNDWIVTEDQYDEEFKNWRRPIHNGQFRSQTLKEKRNTEETCSKYAGSTKFNGIPREGKPAIPINSYKDQCREHMIRNGM